MATEPRGGKAGTAVLPSSPPPETAAAGGRLEGLSPEKRRLLELMLAERRDRAAAPAGAPARAGAIPRLAGGEAPLSFTQERLWFIHRLDPGNPAYNVPAAVRLDGPLAAGALARALGAAVARHDTLRTRFPEAGGRPRQVIDGAVRVRLRLLDLAAARPDRRRVDALLRRLVRLPFDLGTGPLLRANLLRLGRDEHVLLLVIHHVVCDTWSINLLVAELSAHYAAELAGGRAPLPTPPIRFADYAAWQRRRAEEESQERDLAYWKAALAGAPEALELPTDRPRPPVQSFHGTKCFVRLPRVELERLHELGRRRGASLFMTLLAGFCALCARLSGQADLVVGTPVANRVRPELEGLVGPLLNSLLLRAALGGDPGFAEVLGRVRETVVEGFGHAELPFERLVAELAPERDLGRNALFQVSLILQNAPRSEVRLDALALTPLDVDAGTTQLDLTLQLTEGADGLTGFAEYDSALFDATTVTRWIGSFRTLLAAAAERPETRLSALPLLTPAERHRLLHAWNDTASRRVGEAETVAGRFEAVAADRPDATALSIDGEAVSYGELERRSARIARRLAAAGAAPGGVVGVLAERSTAMVTALLAVLRAGAAYLPLDPAHPAEHLAFQLGDALGEGGVVVAAGELAGRLPAAAPGAPRIEVLKLGASGRLRPRPAAGDERRGTPGLPRVSSGHPAYVIYTSGSTGRPKGVTVSHGQVLNRLDWMQGAYRLGPRDRVLQKTTYTFDVSVWELFWPLIEAAELTLARPGGQGDPAYLVDLVRRRGVTVLHFVPSMLRPFVEEPELERCTGLRWALASGEALPFDLEQRFLERSGAALVNQYGPTEAAIDVTAWRARPAARPRPVPIGRPGANTRLYAVDRALRPVPAGVHGELLIAGDQVATGYLRRPGLTALRFVPDPFSERPGDRAYRTGDRVRFDAAGRIEYLGRLDHQVKVRGFRIEPGEVEAALRRHPGVRECAVVPWEPRPGDVRLAAYAVAAEGEAGAPPAAAELRAHLSAALPEHMVPASFTLLPALPLTASGKLDRRALPAPDLEPAGAGGPARRPATPVEESLAAIWTELLGVRRLGVDDRFFDHGAHSLVVTQAVSRIRDVFGVELPLRAVFEAPTVAGLALRIESARSAGEEPLPPVVPVPRDRPLPLSFSQERMWFIQQLRPALSAYNAPGAVTLDGRLDPRVLARALTEIARRHESLRTRLPMVDGRPVQAIAPPAPVELPLIDLSALGPERARAVSLEIARREARRPFDLAAGPLLRVRLIRRAAGLHLLDMTLHHVVYDMWAREVFIRELAALYGAFAAGAPSPLPEPAIQYADFAAWQREVMAGEAMERQLAWWRGQLAGAPAALELMPDRPRPAVQRFRGARVYFDLPDDLAAAVRGLGRREAATVYMVLLAGFETLLARSTGARRIVVGTPVANRNRAEVEGLIGFLANVLVLHTDLGGDPDFRTVLGRVRETALGAFTHQDLPFERLVEALAPARDLSRQPLFQVMFNYLQDYGTLTVELDRLTLGVEEVHNGGAPYDLSLHMWSLGERFRGAVDFNTGLYDRTTVERLIDRLRILLAAAAAEPATRIRDLPLLSEAERRQLAAWNAPDPAVPALAPGETVIDRIAARAAEDPGAAAAASEDGRLSRGELDAAATRLARRLAGRGIGSGDRVALALPRNLDLLVAVLGVLRAGAAFLPLDPRLPAARIRRILDDGRVRAAVVGGEGGAALEAARAEPGAAPDPEPLPFAALVDPAAALPERAPAAPGPRDPAYVLFTSGSTGRPKGVVIEHRGLLNHLDRKNRWLGLGAGDRLAQTAAASFDISIWQLLGALAEGGRVEILSDAAASDPRRLWRALGERGVTVLEIVPTLMRVLIEGLEGPEALPPSLRWVIFTGEELPADLAAAWRRIAPGVRTGNAYGPTECSNQVTVHELAGSEAASGEPARIPIGRPLAGLLVHVVDRRLGAQPPGVPGELAVAGIGLARGYLHDPRRTAESFVPDPFAGEPGGRLYLTGDIARRRADGRLEYLGRIDHQVKVRGFRVELGEIEAALRRHPAVADAVAAVAPIGGAADARLVAYAVPRAAEGGSPDGLDADGLDADELRRFVAARLPEYMVPQRILTLEGAIPRTASGKVDRRALPPPDAAGAGGPEHVPPEGETEVAVAGIWRELLGAEAVGRNDNFFFLGGHSLLAARVLHRVRERFAVELPLVTFFESATLGELARAVDVARWAAHGAAGEADAAGEIEEGEL